MSSQPIRTTTELPDPWLYVEVVDGRVTTLQLDRASLTRDREQEVAEAVTRATNTALEKQAAELLAPTVGEVDDDRFRVLAFVDKVLGETDPAAGGRPDAAPSDATTARVVDGLFEGLWIDTALLDRGHPLEVEEAVRNALNEALERYEADAASAAVDPDTAERAPGWDTLAQTIDRIERGLL